MTEQNLSGRVAVVTGGGSGIGRAIALGLAGAGASVVVGDLFYAKAEDVSNEIEAAGGTALPLTADVSKTEDADEMVENAVKQFGRIDILVNNAGRATRAFISQITDEEWDAVVAVNLRGTFVCTRAALRHMIPQRSGRIVNTASGAGLRPFPGGAVYGASKAAIIHFTRSLAAEVSRYGITANAIGPGVTDTPFWRAFRSQEDIEASLKTGQVGQPDDFVPLVLFLCSDAGGMHSGHMFDRDVYMPRSER
jgi:NAD(P)-dependent dehydrogenase (short-subunit alcohol dehydrogenase family)